MVFCQRSLMIKGEGEPCDVPVGPGPILEAVMEECASGLCFRGTCVAYSDLGGSCPCLDGLKCDYATDTCVPLRGTGESCGDLGDCASLACDTSTKTCMSVSASHISSCNDRSVGGD